MTPGKRKKVPRESQDEGCYRVILTGVQSGYEAKVRRIVKRWTEESVSIPMVVTPGNTLPEDSALTPKLALKEKGGTAEVRKVECL